MTDKIVLSGQVIAPNVVSAFRSTCGGMNADQQAEPAYAFNAARKASLRR